MQSSANFDDRSTMRSQLILPKKFTKIPSQIENSFLNKAPVIMSNGQCKEDLCPEMTLEIFTAGMTCNIPQTPY